MMSLTTLSHFLIAAIPFVSCLPYPNIHHPAPRALPPANWYHQRDHSVHSLFRRQESDIGNLPAVGSPEWAAKWPTADPYANIPQPWLDALRDAVSSGAVPNIPVSNLTTGSPTYGDLDPAGPTICSATYQCRGKDEIWDAPDGMIGLSVDDGPVAIPDASPRLYDYLKEQNQKITHFMVGANIRDNPQVFLRAFQELENDIAVHTWSHPHMTTLTNEQVVAEIGWTLQIIHDSTGGRIPRYWRPPFGDADNRVRTIASEIFGLTCVIWNRDTGDWKLSSGGTTLDEIQAQFKEWLAGPRSPGLMVLEHEIEGGDVTAFINALPLIRQSKEWTAVSVAQVFENQPSGSWYLNAQNNTSPVTAMTVGGLETPALSNSTSPLPASNSTSPLPASNSTSPSPASSSTGATITSTGPTTISTGLTTDTPTGSAITTLIDPSTTISTNPSSVLADDTAIPTDAITASAGTPTTRGETTTIITTTSRPTGNNAIANANSAGVVTRVPSHLGPSLVSAILFALSGSMLL